MEEGVHRQEGSNTGKENTQTCNISLNKWNAYVFDKCISVYATCVITIFELATQKNKRTSLKTKLVVSSFYMKTLTSS